MANPPTIDQVVDNDSLTDWDSLDTGLPFEAFVTARPIHTGMQFYEVLNFTFFEVPL